MATRAVVDKDFGLVLCEILKLDSKKTRTITIVSPPDDFVHVTVEQILQEDESEKLMVVLNEYHLVQNDKPDNYVLNQLEWKFQSFKKENRKKGVPNPIIDSFTFYTWIQDIKNETNKKSI